MAIVNTKSKDLSSEQKTLKAKWKIKLATKVGKGNLDMFKPVMNKKG